MPQDTGQATQPFTRFASFFLQRFPGFLATQEHEAGQAWPEEHPSGPDEALEKQRQHERNKAVVQGCEQALRSKQKKQEREQTLLARERDELLRQVQREESEEAQKEAIKRDRMKKRSEESKGLIISLRKAVSELLGKRDAVITRAISIDSTAKDAAEKSAAQIGRASCRERV